MRLHAKIILVLVPLVALPLATLGWVAYSQQRDSVKQDAIRQLGTVVHEVERNFRARLSATRSDLILFANSQMLRRYLLVEDEGQRFRLLQPALLKLFASYQLANPEYYEIRVLLPDGYEDTRATTKPLPNTTDEEADTDYFQVMSSAEQDVLAQIVHNPDNGRYAVMVSHRIALVDTSVDPVLAKPRLRGYLVVTMDLDFLHRQAHDVSHGRGGLVLFADRMGRTLFDERSHVSERGNAVPQSISAKILAEAESDSLSEASLLRERFLIRARRLHENLYVLAMYPEAELLSSTRRIAKVALALIAATILLTAALLYGFLRSLLLVPLARIGRAAREIGAGQLITDVGIRRKDEIGQLAVSFEEMSRNLQSSHDQVAYLAHHDSLTGLPNRRMFMELLQRSLTNATRSKEMLALLFLDLDDFKRVNDSLGHQLGDELLQEFGSRLLSVIRSEVDSDVRGTHEQYDTVARLGGDEFIVLLHDLTQPMQAASVARRLIDELTRPFVVNGHELRVNASIGITAFPNDAGSAEELVKNADIAMYHAKEQGKNHYQFFTHALNAELLRRIEMESALRKALTRDELFLHYQPQVNATSGAIVGVEALLRWRHPELGMVSPSEFIPLAEETGLIVPIGEWVLREACRQSKSWQLAGARAVPIAVNISARQFAGTELERAVRQALAESGLSPEHLDIELTESSVMTEPDAAIETLLSLKAIGVGISMDDFGTGYSSLGVLKRLPIDCLKIDKSFVDEIKSEHDDSVITVAIIAMAKSLGLEVIAEGVEQLSQLAFLQSRGCEMIQGYLISKPVSGDDMQRLLCELAPFPARWAGPAQAADANTAQRKLEVVR